MIGDAPEYVCVVVVYVYDAVEHDKDDEVIDEELEEDELVDG